jgi:electron transport complex protein RnfG
MIKSISKNATTLALFAVACTFVVSATHLVTAKRIKSQQRQQLMASIAAVTTTQIDADSLLKHCRQIVQPKLLGSDAPKRIWNLDANTDHATMVYETVAPDGYSGSIDLLVAVKANGRLSGVRTTRHNETPGLGDKIDIRKSNWIRGFKDKWLKDEADSRWAVKKDGGEFDAFTGATITPRAVIKAVKNVLILNRDIQTVLATAQPCAEE